MNDIFNKIHNCINQDIIPLLPDKSVQVFRNRLMDEYLINLSKYSLSSGLVKRYSLKAALATEMRMLSSEARAAAFLGFSVIKAVSPKWSPFVRTPRLTSFPDSFLCMILTFPL